MAKLLEALKAQGVEITEEVEKAVMADFVEKKDADLKDVEITDLKGQITKRDTDITELKKTDPGLKKQLEDMEIKYNQDTKDLGDKLADAKITGELKLALAQSKTKDVDLLVSLIDKSQLKFTDDGKLDGLDDQLTKLRTDKSFLFSTDEPGKETKPGYQYKPGGAEEKATEKVSLEDAVAEALSIE